MHRLALLLLAAALVAWADEADEAKKRWASSPHGPMLERLLPPTFEARQLPDPASDGAQLTLQRRFGATGRHAVYLAGSAVYYAGGPEVPGDESQVIPTFIAGYSVGITPWMHVTPSI